jgi:GT2 family glycosyltransferase
LQQGADYVLLLNNDTVIAKGAIEELVRAAEEDATIGIISPKILFYEPRDLVWFGGAEFNDRCLTGRMVGYGLEDLGQFDQERDIAFVSGCAMLIRRQVIETVGLLWDDLFAVMEDLDYSLRVARHGYRLRYVPVAVVWHKESMSAGGHDAPQYVYYQTRNALLLRRKWANGLYQRPLSGVYALLYFSMRTVRFAWQRKWRSILGLVYGVRDGLLGRKGRCEYNLLAAAGSGGTGDLPPRTRIN